jgi:hypothetical protein
MLACTNIACGCSPRLATAVISGQVTMDTGGPAPLAAMYAQATPTVACASGTLSSWGRADSSGRYRIAVFGASLGSGDSGCVFIGALFPPTRLGRTRSLDRSDEIADPPLDSVTVISSSP